MDFKRVYEELNVLLPFSMDVKVQQSQHEQMVVMSFLVGLPSEFDTTKTRILSSSELPSLHETFTRVLYTETSQSFRPVANNSLVSCSNWNEVGCQSNRSGNKGGGTSNCDKSVDGRNHESGGIVCYHCHESGHRSALVGNFKTNLSEFSQQMLQLLIL